VSVKKFKDKAPRPKKKAVSLETAAEIIKEHEEKIDEDTANDLLKRVKNKKKDK
jgi:HD-GYP domain-containing protein (c-di-GMP phosphodiesterase class II)